MPTAVRRFVRKVYIGGLLIWAVGDLLNPQLRRQFGELRILLSGILGSAFVNSLNWALVFIIAEYGEWRTGKFVPKGPFIPGSPSFAKCPLAGFFPDGCYSNYIYPTWYQPVPLKRLPPIFISLCPRSVGHDYNGLVFTTSTRKMYIRIVEEIEVRKRTASLTNNID